jgi:riboflavin kinase/FMN adenylyltransferase
MNVGRRPTLTAGDVLVPEVHILDFEGDLRGRRLAFRMRSRLRSEQNFPSVKELKHQIAADIEEVRHLADGWDSADSPVAEPPDSC